MSEIYLSNGERFNPFEKRTQKQRDQDRQFIADYLIHDPESTKKDIYLKLMEHVALRGDNYTLDYTYVCSEINRVKKEARNFKPEFLQNEIENDLEIINDNIKLCLTEIQKRYTKREQVTTEIMDLTVKDMKGMAIDEIYAINKLKDRVKKRKVIVKELLPGSDIKEMMDVLIKWLERKATMLGIDAPRKIAQKVDHSFSFGNVTKEVFEEEIKRLGFDPIPFLELFNKKNKNQNQNGQS